MISTSIKLFTVFILCGTIFNFAASYDPDDDQITPVEIPKGQFEAFYPKESHGVPNGSSRPSHGHGSFYKHRNPALVDVKNPSAYGYRFDGERRFNFD